MNIFKVNTDTTVYIISIIVVLFCLILPIVKINKPIISFSLIAYVLPIVLLVVTLLFVPTSYVLTKDQIVIKKVCGSIEINKVDIVDVSLAGNELKGSVRTFASGGLFGYFGKYSSPKLGKYNMYAGTMKANNLLVIKLKNGKKYVISPKGIDDFLLCLKEK